MFLLVRYAFSEEKEEISPALQVAYAGTSVFIKCYSKKPLSWYKDDDYNFLKMTKSKTFTINHVTFRDAGVYICYGRDYGPDREKKLSSTLLVGGK